MRKKVEAVPQLWLAGDKCWWPFVPATKLSKWIEKQVKPKKEMEKVKWEKCNARVLSKPYDSLTYARSKCDLAQFTSDLETDKENGKRVVTKKRHFDEMSNNDETLSEDNNQEEESSANSEKADEGRYPTPPIFATSPIPATSSILTPTPNLPRRSPRKKIDTTPSQEKTTAKRQLSLGISSTSKQVTSEVSVDFELSVLRQLSAIKMCLTKLQQDINKIKEALEERAGPTSRSHEEPASTPVDPDVIGKLPCASLQTLNELELYLTQETNTNTFANFLGSFGGDTLSETMKRMLRFLLTDTAAAEFSWLGRKNKRVFSALHLKTVIFKAVRMNKNLKEVTDKQMEEVIKNWLRPAKFRLSAKKKSTSEAGSSKDAKDGESMDGQNEEGRLPNDSD